ncbi:hypothetical protein LTR10_003179 [Elasticomyces elasticus]|nr:hypothetical protein LTR10_003179 [Elasticomyces elasticus]KAK4969451.1 hypothetical protein LTR42_008721 [Elasticomyces elasticus]
MASQEITPANRIRELNDISGGIAEMLRHMGQAISALAPNPDEGGESMAARKATFDEHSKAAYTGVQAFQAKMRRQAYALEEAGIIAAEAPVIRVKSNQPQAQGAAAGRGGPAAAGAQVVEAERVTNGGLGNLDVGWLNSRGNKVAVEMESELLQEAKDLLKRELERKQTNLTTSYVYIFIEEIIERSLNIFVMTDLLVAMEGYRSSFDKTKVWPISDFARIQRTALAWKPDPRLPAKRAFDASQPLIKVLVGLTEEVFLIHRPILCSSSGYFTARLKPEWSRQSSDEVRLPDADHSAFNIYVNWLYMRGITRSSLDDDDEDAQSEEWLNLADAFVLGDALVDSEFQASVLETLRFMSGSRQRKSFWAVATEVVAVIYDGTPTGSPIREVLLDLFLLHADGQLSDDDILALPEEFLRELEKAPQSLAVMRGWRKAGPGP